MDRVSSLNLTRTLQIHLFLNYKPLRINPMSKVLLCLIYNYSYVLYKTTITLCFEGLYRITLVLQRILHRPTRSNIVDANDSH